jgi:MYXO-CTERM domain-containing protein
LHSTDANALENWLVSNGFLIPDAIRPVVNQYVSEKFDFIALKLRPGETVRAMQPVRVITPGADATLPLRMVAAGIGAYVGLTLFVVSEGRYHPANFPDARIDFSALTWSGLQSRSNYTALADAAMKAGDGRGWLTEAASPPALFSTFNGNGTPNPGLYDAYYGSCRTQPRVMVPCDPSTLPKGDGGTAVDAGTADSGGDASTDAGSVMGMPDSGSCYRSVSACDALDDLNVALTGMHQSDVWVTRLRAFLPASALNGDLRLEPASGGVSQADSFAPSAHHTDRYTETSYDPCGDAGAANRSNPMANPVPSDSGCACATKRASERSGSLFLLGLSAIAAVGLVRRRSRR